jgi:hypothetical protein
MQVKILLRVRRHLVLGQNPFFVQPEAPGITADETTREDSPGELGEIFPFYGLQKPQANLGRGGYFLQAHSSHLSLTAKILTKGGHMKVFLASCYHKISPIIFSRASGCQML